MAAAVYLQSTRAALVPSAVGLLLGLAVAYSHLAVIGTPDDLHTMGMVALVLLVPWALGRLETAQRGRITELHTRSELLEQQRAEAELAAAERERALLARELHDILNHSVTAMVLDSEAGAETGDEQEARQTLRRVADTGRTSLAELRRLLGVLRATNETSHGPAAEPGPAGPRITPPPTLARLDDLVAAIPANGPQITLRRQGQVRQLDASIELAGYRIVQESLTNAAKHAGAVEVAVLLQYLPDQLEIQVHNGPPRRPNPASDIPGTGLIGMHERADLLGGSLHAGPDPAGGFTVHATLPIGVVG